MLRMVVGRPGRGMGLNAQLPLAVPPSELVGIGVTALSDPPAAVSACVTPDAHMAPWSLAPSNLRMAL